MENERHNVIRERTRNLEIDAAVLIDPSRTGCDPETVQYQVQLARYHQVLYLWALKVYIPEGESGARLVLFQEVKTALLSSVCFGYA